MLQRGKLQIGAHSCGVATQSFAGFQSAAIEVSILSDIGAAGVRCPPTCRAHAPFTEPIRSCCALWRPARVWRWPNLNLHHDIQRQAIADDLTGLATHGHFQELEVPPLDQDGSLRITASLAFRQRLKATRPS